MNKKKVILLLAITLLLLLYILIASPNLNIFYSEGAFFWCLAISLYTAVLLLYDVFAFFSQYDFSGRPVIKFEKKKAIPKYKILIVIIPWLAFFIVNILSTPLFNSDAYKNQLDELKVSDFSADIQAIDINSIPVVDKQLAYTIADKKLGEKPSLGSQVALGEPVIQTVKGKLVWVVPLYHSGFFKWISNLDGSPGYIIVSATNIRDVTYVENYKIKYQPNAYFFDNLERKARFSGALFTGITDYSFELDDNGKPFWILTTYQNKWGFELPEAKGILLMDATTGDTKAYNLENLPTWVDRVQPESFIMRQIENKGEYVNGVFNFSNKDKFETSDGHIIVYNNGKCFLLTGLTSVGADESTIGFVLVNMVTKETYHYQVSGATEYSAQKSAEGKVQDLGYNASFPLILNVNGQPTYFMTLKDNEGLIKQYAYVSVKDYSVVGVGDTINSALNNFEISMRNTTNTSINVGNQKLTVDGKLIRFAAINVQSSTVYRFLLDTVPDKIFEASYDVSPELSLSVQGDPVTIEYIPGQTGTQTVVNFDNLSFEQK